MPYLLNDCLPNDLASSSVQASFQWERWAVLQSLLFLQSLWNTLLVTRSRVSNIRFFLTYCNTIQCEITIFVNITKFFTYEYSINVFHCLFGFCYQAVPANGTHFAHSGHCFAWTGLALPGYCVCQSAAVCERTAGSAPQKCSSAVHQSCWRLRWRFTQNSKSLKPSYSIHSEIDTIVS